VCVCVCGGGVHMAHDTFSPLVRIENRFDPMTVFAYKSDACILKQNEPTRLSSLVMNCPGV